jgi:hypothetical protein
MKHQEEYGNEIGDLAKILDHEYTVIERMKISGDTVIHIIAALIIFVIAIVFFIIAL